MKFNITRQKLVDRFGGLTNTPSGFSLQGWWQSAGTVVRDDMVVWTVLTQGNENGYFPTYREVLKEHFAQQELFIVKIPAEAL